MDWRLKDRTEEEARVIEAGQYVATFLRVILPRLMKETTPERNSDPTQSSEQANTETTPANTYIPLARR